MLCMKAKLRSTVLRIVILLTLTAVLTSCYTTHPQRDEPSPLAPQWLPFQHHRR